MSPHRIAIAVLAVLVLAGPAAGRDLATKNGGDTAPLAQAATDAAPTDWALFVPPTDGTFTTWEMPPDIGLVERLFQLIFTEECSWAMGSGIGQETEVYDLTYRYSYETEADPMHDLKLYRFFCSAGAYNEVHVYLTWDTSWGLRPVSFAEPALDVTYVDGDSLEGAVESISIAGYHATHTLVNSVFDPANQTIISASKWRGLGDASSSGTYALRDGSFVLTRYDADPSYDGEINPFVIVDLTQTAPIELVPADPE
jgi:hypothetical protein